MIPQNRITITVTNVEQGNQAHKRFHCGHCRASSECAGLGTCRLINYLNTNKFLQTSSQGVFVDMDKTLAKVNIRASQNDFLKTLNIVNRAIRLRTHRYNVRACR